MMPRSKSKNTTIRQALAVHSKKVAQQVGQMAKQKLQSELKRAMSTGTGSGAYNFGKAGKRVMRAAGKAIASKIAGGGLYTGSGLYLPQVGGRGAYTTNNLIEGIGHQGSGIHRMSSSRDETGTVTMTHREYIMDVYAPGVAAGPAVPFQNQVISINPGLQGFLPFASQIACNYVEYELVQCIFEYNSTTTDIGSSTTGQCGTVILALQYNAAESAFTDKQTMMEYAHAVSAKVTESIAMGVECDPAKRAGSESLYVRANPVISNQDLKTYDHGTLNIAVSNCPPAYNGLTLGELWCHYTVRLRKPRLFSTRGYDIDADTVYTSSTIDTLTPALFFGPLSSSKFLRGQQNNIGCLFQQAVGGMKITLPANYAGNLRALLKINGTGITAGPTVTSGGNITNISDVYGPTGLVAQGSTVNTAVDLIQIYDFFVGPSTGGVDNFIAFTGMTATTVNSTSLTISQYGSLATSQNPLNATTSRVIFVNANGVATVPT